MDSGLFRALRKVVNENEAEQIVNTLTPEEIDEVAATLEVAPELLDEFTRGILVEAEHLSSVGGDKLIIGKIVLDHINAFPGKDYYGALMDLKRELGKTPEEEEKKEDEVETPEEEGKKEDEVIVQPEELPKPEFEEQPIGAKEGRMPEVPSRVDDKTMAALREKDNS